MAVNGAAGPSHEAERPSNATPQTGKVAITKPDSSRETEDVLEEVRKAILSVRFGNVQVIVQDGKVVQIDKTEKIRLT